MTVTEDERFNQFSAVLLTEMLERTKKNMELLTPERSSPAPLPFAQTPSLFDIYTEVVKVGIFPIVVSRRPVRALMGDTNWAKDGRETLLTLMDDRACPIFPGWDYAWDSLWNERKASVSSKPAAAGKKKGGFLSSLLGRKPKNNPKAKKVEEDSGAPVMAGLHSMLNEVGEKRGCLPLLPDDTRLFKGLIRTKPSRLLAAWKELSQYYHQEFVLKGKEQAKTGALSEALQKWQFNLADRVGELMIIKCVVDLDHLDKTYIGKYIRQSARTQEEAERGMPCLSAYWKLMPDEN